MENIIGKKYHRLTVLEKKEHGYYLCKCDCGNLKEIKKYNFTSGGTRSCGCYYKETRYINNKKHGLSKHPLYKTWHNIRGRCKNPNSTKYNIYGGKGINICNEWDNSFKNFYDWSIENGWKKGLTIERKNSSKNYSPENCKWATYKEQNNNTSQNHKITYIRDFKGGDS